MNLKKYVPPDRWYELSHYKDIASARTLMQAVEAKREELRKPVEKGDLLNNPEYQKDLPVFKLGMIAMANWILELPGQAGEHIKHLPEGARQ